MRFYRYLLLLAVILSSLTPTLAVRAAPQGAVCTGLAPVSWTETRIGSFALLFPAGDEVIRSALSLFDAEVLESEYARFAALFETTLPLPISIRVYPTENHYYCLNAGPPEIQVGSMHSHIGAREIAFIAENILRNFQGWVVNYQEMFRYEQALLFAEQVSAGQLPPGLLAAIGRYAQNPLMTLAPLSLTLSDGDSRAYPWSELWDSLGPQGDLGRRLHALSTVAFLLDEYGWPRFLQFLQDLPSSGGYRALLTQVYGQDFSALERAWQAYVPGYFSGRWRVNLIYNYDLAPYSEQIAAGNYAEAAKGLQEVIAFLEKINAGAKLRQARGLLSQAAFGGEANDLVIEARKALAEGEYERSIDLLDQAQHNYSLIRYYHRMDELNTYRAQVQEVQALHSELEQLAPRVEASPNIFSLAGRLVEVGTRLGQLGDARGQEQVRALALRIEERQRGLQFALTALGALLVLGLLGLRIALLWRRPAPEAEL